MSSRLLAAFLLITLLLLDLPRPFRGVRPEAGCRPGPWAELGVRLLRCDEDSGRVALALGDPVTARHVAVLVPGLDAGLRHLEHPVDPHRGPLGWARALRSAARSADVAVVLWIDYRTPRTGSIDALFGRAARTGAAELARFLVGLRARHRGPAGLHICVVGHSYGAVVATTAAPVLPLGPDDDLVLLASPGAGVASVAGLGTAARVWAGRAVADWVRWVPPVRIGDLGHGPDPAAPAFGARALDTSGVLGHDRYFLPGTPAVAALAGVVVSRAAAPAPAPGRPGRGW
jgi:hypothetical protein